jgi:hypothetical protein
LNSAKINAIKITIFMDDDDDDKEKYKIENYLRNIDAEDNKYYHTLELF